MEQAPNNSRTSAGQTQVRKLFPKHERMCFALALPMICIIEMSILYTSITKYIRYSKQPFKIVSFKITNVRQQRYGEFHDVTA